MQHKSHLVLIGITGVVIGLCARPSASQDQKAASLAFEVASIKPANTNDPRKFIDMRNGKLVAQNRTVKELMNFAYAVQTLQVSGGPNWTDSEGFDIEAKSEMNPTAQQLREIVLFGISCSHSQSVLNAHPLRIRAQIHGVTGVALLLKQFGITVEDFWQYRFLQSHRTGKVDDLLERLDGLPLVTLFEVVRPS